MRLILERRGKGFVKYRKRHVLQANTDYPVQEVRMDAQDFAALHAAFPDPGMRGWCEKMLAMFNGTHEESAGGESA